MPQPKKTDPYFPLYLAAAGLGSLISCCIASLSLLRRYRRLGYVLWADTGNFGMNKRRRYAVITPHQPPALSPAWRGILNRYTLPRGDCCVCKGTAVVVLKLPKCKHALCMDCASSYLEAALGDLSMFPIKCPMHFDGCTSHLDAYIARRVLIPAQYSRFLEFLDRATYGDGMRCIFCLNFVIYPADMASMTGLLSSRVECPHCIQKFCIRCKQPWHYGNNNKCALDRPDEQLAAWARDSGAQRCPACHKLIEKDDPDTCNHMHHKATEGCVRERCDFCYLCGEEVLPDYPHDEKSNPGINHFPDGVFQK